MVNPSFLDLKSGIRKKVSTSFRICRPVTFGFGVQFQSDSVSGLNRICCPVIAGLYRATVLRKTEATLTELASKENLLFQPFWIEVPNWVKANAKWYQKVSAQNILRLWIPLLFAVAWLFLGIFCITHLASPSKPTIFKNTEKEIILTRAHSSTISPPQKNKTKITTKKNKKLNLLQQCYGRISYRNAPFRNKCNGLFDCGRLQKINFR